MACWLNEKMYFSAMHTKLGRDSVTGCPGFTFF